VRYLWSCWTPLIDLTLLRIPTSSIAIWGGNLFRLGSGALPFLLVLLFCGVICGSSLLLFRHLRGGAGAGLYKVVERE
jgi:hypothetical protein